MYGEYSAKKFYLYTFLYTFIFWMIGAYYSLEKNSNYYLFLLLGLVTPFLVSLFLIFNSSDNLKNQYKRKFFNFQGLDIKIIFIMVFIIPFTIFISILISIIFGESLSQFNISKDFSFSVGVLPVLLLLLFAAIFEELGWRGYGFESLLKKYNFFYSSIIFSLLWSFWHFPLIFVDGSYQNIIFNQNIYYGLNFFISIVPLGIIVSWIWIQSNKNILVAILFHFIINISQELFDITQTTKIIQTFILFCIVCYIVYRNEKLFFGRSK